MSPGGLRWAMDLMEPEDAEDVLRLMTYEDYSAGGMMTTEPLILSADDTVADALAVVRQGEISPPRDRRRSQLPSRRNRQA